MESKRAAVIVVLAVIILGGLYFLFPGEIKKPPEKVDRAVPRNVSLTDEQVHEESIDYMVAARITGAQKARFAEITGRIAFQANETNETTTTLLLDPSKGWYEEDKGDYEYKKYCKETSCDTVTDSSGLPVSYFTTNAWTGLAWYSSSVLDREIFPRRSKEKLYWAICDMQLVMDECDAEPRRCLWVAVHMKILRDGLQEVTYPSYPTLNDPDLYKSLGNCPHTVDNQREDLIDKYEQIIVKVGAASIGNPRTGDTLVASFETRGLLGAYKITGNASYLEAAEESVKKTRELLWPNDTVLYNIDGFDVRQNACWTHVAELDLYDATLKAQHLDSARDFADRSRLESYAGDTNFISELAPCLEAFLRLKPQGEKYKAQGDTLKNYVYNNFLDSPLFPLYSGEGGYVFTSVEALDATDLKDWGNIKALTDTSYMTYALARFGK